MRNVEMSVGASVIGTWQTVALRGKFTIRNLALIRQYFEATESTPVPGVMIDMSGVVQLDSSAITLLVNFQRRIVQKDGIIVLVGMQSDIAEIFSIVGIDKIFRSCSSEEEFRRLYDT